MDPFWTYARLLLRYRGLLALAMVFAALSAGGLGAGLLGMKPILDKVLGDSPKALPDLAGELNVRLAEAASWAPQIPQSWIDALPTGQFTAIVWLVVGLGLLTMIGATCNFLHAYLSLTIISRTIANIRREAFRHVLHLPLRTVVAAGPSDMVSRIVFDSAALSVGFNALLSRVVAQVTKGLAAVAVAFWFNPILAGAALIAAPVVYTIIRKLGKRIRRASKSALKSQADLYHAASEVLTGLRVVKAHCAERIEAGRFHRINKSVIEQEFKVRTARALSSPLIETVALFILGTLSLVAIKAILNGHLDRGTFLIVLGSLGVAGASLKPITGLVNDIQQASAAAARLRELTGNVTEPGHGVRLPRLPRHAESLAFERVSLTYANAAQPAIDDVSLRVPFGATYAFVGPNGCGKTTLLSLVPRFFDPDAAAHERPQGRVLVDGGDVRDFAVRSLRRQIAAVTQETVLFRGTIRENIAYGAEDLGDAATAFEKIRDAARRARAEEFILAKPGGYDAMLGEGGSGLSGGQRQRIAIARAILRDPAILILDEATSMIDAESEAQIAEAIGEFVHQAGRRGTANGRGSAGRTCLIVAHRLSTVLAADQIVVMDKGRIVDQGTHSELLGRCSLYQRLAKEQLIDAAQPAAINKAQTSTVAAGSSAE